MFETPRFRRSTRTKTTVTPYSESLGTAPGQVEDAVLCVQGVHLRTATHVEDMKRKMFGGRGNSLEREEVPKAELAVREPCLPVLVLLLRVVFTVVPGLLRYVLLLE